MQKIPTPTEGLQSSDPSCYRNLGTPTAEVPEDAANNPYVPSPEEEEMKRRNRRKRALFIVVPIAVIAAVVGTIAVFTTSSSDAKAVSFGAYGGSPALSLAADTQSILSTAAQPGASSPSGDLSNFQPNPFNLTPDEIDFIVKVRQAGLWETPSGQQALQRGNSPLVKKAGKIIADNHIKLDEMVRSIADQLGVLLPTQPNPTQMGFMTELSSKMGDDYDRAFANNIRSAHGGVFVLIGKVRATTMNPIIRDFASAAVTIVMSHMRLAEETGLVDAKSFALPPPK